MLVHICPGEAVPDFLMGRRWPEHDNIRTGIETESCVLMSMRMGEEMPSNSNMNRKERSTDTRKVYRCIGRVF